MRRTQIQLDERTDEILRRRAFQKGCPISSCVREVLADSLGTAKGTRRPTIKDFSFMGSRRSSQGRLSPVPERHDEALRGLARLGKRRVSLLDQVDFLVMRRGDLRIALAFDPDFDDEGLRVFGASR